MALESTLRHPRVHVIAVAGTLVLGATSALAAPPPGSGPHFTDLTNPAVFGAFRAITASASPLPLNPHPAPAWADWDGDGDLDLPGYRNDAGVFVDVAEASGLVTFGHYRGAVWGDFDSDGDLDAVVLAYTDEGRRDVLYRNAGDGTFVDIAPANGMDHAGYGETASWGDFDGDGDLDLLVANYECGALWWNDGDGHFHEGIAASGLDMCMQTAVDPCGGATTRPEGVTAFDGDGDGWLDVYAAGHLWRNQGDGTFVDVTDLVGGLRKDAHDESFAPADLDNDGDLDLMIYYQGCGTLALLAYDAAAGTYDERAALPATASMVGLRWADVDNDGDLDLFAPDYYLPFADSWFVNQGDWNFTRVVEWRFDAAGAALAYRSAFASFGDYDRDGDVDLALWKYDVPAEPEVQYRLVQNDLDPVGGWLAVRVLDAAGHATENGAIVRLTEGGGGPGGSTQTRYVDGGTDWAVDAYDVHFGVDDAATYALSVTFPRHVGEELWVVDAVAVRCLEFVPGALAGRVIAVRRDGSVEVDGVACAGVEVEVENEVENGAEVELTADVGLHSDRGCAGAEGGLAGLAGLAAWRFGRRCARPRWAVLNRVQRVLAGTSNTARCDSARATASRKARKAG